MKVILWMAMSVNGIIARENNEEDFLSHQGWNEWVKFIRDAGCMVWGAKTYKVVSGWKKEYFKDIEGVRAIIVSSNLKNLSDERFGLANSPQNALEILKKEGFDRVVLTGGSTLNSSFAKLGLIDEIVLSVEPVVVGQGIPLFKSDLFDLKLELVSIAKINQNLIQLHYRVVK